MKEGQLGWRIVCDCDAAQVIELMQTKIRHAGNSKTYCRVNEDSDTNEKERGTDSDDNEGSEQSTVEY